MNRRSFLKRSCVALGLAVAWPLMPSLGRAEAVEERRQSGPYNGQVWHAGNREYFADYIFIDGEWRLLSFVGGGWAKRLPNCPVLYEVISSGVGRQMI